VSGWAGRSFEKEADAVVAALRKIRPNIGALQRELAGALKLETEHTERLAELGWELK
jgi:hypothetical protein